MSYAKNVVARHKKRKKVIKQAKGYFGAKSISYKKAKEQLMKSYFYAYRDRKQRKRDFKKLWNIRISAACLNHNLSYHDFVHALKVNKIILNHKMLSLIAQKDQDLFAKIVKKISLK